ncbi:hypothetical protein HPB52_006287 [Rhipicephalus sanguineus]|uniref:Uncharacterized protein n=1 Tax=Rhipicephalus sanguineus TaxID=34632 RepID=A0A9D4PK76_RHISA|nr:hypothetical protein HPB52_006287 [Rhipicephalus sanguineus]
MEVMVEGEEISKEEYNDGSWTALEAQRRCARQLAPAATASEQTENNEADTAQGNEKKAPKYRARPPFLPKRKPLPKLPPGDYKVILRPQTAVKLLIYGAAKLFKAVCAATQVPIEDAISEDQVRVHPNSNTALISTPSRARAEGYNNIKILKIGQEEIEVVAYAPAPENSTKGVIYYACSDETDEAIFKELQARNPSIELVGARRLGTKHIVAVFAGTERPEYVRQEQSRPCDTATQPSTQSTCYRDALRNNQPVTKAQGQAQNTHPSHQASSIKRARSSSRGRSKSRGRPTNRFDLQGQKSTGAERRQAATDGRQRRDENRGRRQQHATAGQVERRYSSERLQLGQGMDDNVDGDAVTETTDACAENGANTPMDLTNANDHALVSGESSDPHDADRAVWQLSQTLRQRKKQALERRNLAVLQAQQKQMVNSQKMGPRGQKLPPLPKDDYKIVIQPHQCLTLKAITAPALARAIIEACDNQFTDETFILRINRGSSIAILSTKYSEVAKLVRKLHQLAINGKPHPLRAYVATGEEAFRGVVHDI